MIFREPEQRRPAADYHRAMYDQAIRTLVGETFGDEQIEELEGGSDRGSSPAPE